MTRYLIVLFAMAAVIAAPMILRPAASVRTEDYAEKDRLVIITPHVETLRYELERGFTRWMQEKHGRRVVIDWRVPGGTSDIIKVVNSEFTAAQEISKDRGIGLDLMTGGGPIDYLGLKKSGHIVAADKSGKFGPLAVKAAHPDWFTDAAIPDKLSGQELYDPDFVWIGTCLSSFGICWNVENLERRGLAAPQTWADLADPMFEPLACVQVMAQRVGQGLIGFQQEIVDSTVAATPAHVVDKPLHGRLIRLTKGPGFGQQLFVSLDVAKHDQIVKGQLEFIRIEDV